MDRRAFAASAAASLALAACSDQSGKFQNYHGPRVTSVVVNKGARHMYLLNNNDILRKYKVDLGFAPRGHKRIEGDGKTPEGQYWINRRNPNSAFHLSLGISYPNAQDIAKARALGKSPGGEIFIHGQPNILRDRKRAERASDWTAGCIAVKNGEMEEIYAMIKNGIPIFLNA
ncbi:L,D-transpeptidase family protein [Epibacterium ulvae]|uniref:L,D-transpeptidase family protein n=1 Tax=Epibacterium ulvae TaxID=1156985 RepID=UPI001BFC7649|nr:L,D-transpeptidase family protein [Epibacterium ulvae]MBT8153570.1 L,D-transpeptidase family protein [Epibacterium ulvae]